MRRILQGWYPRFANTTQRYLQHRFRSRTHAPVEEFLAKLAQTSAAEFPLAVGVYWLATGTRRRASCLVAIVMGAS